MTESKVIKYKADGLNVTLTVTRANGRQGMLRSLMQQDAFRQEDEKAPAEGSGLLEQADRWLHTITYPSCVAVTTEQKGFKEWPIPFDQFAELPEPLLMEWEQTVYELNAHWFNKVRGEKETEEAKKKV